MVYRIRRMNKTIAVFIILFFILNVDAAKIGVVVEFPGDAIITECVEVDDNTNGYDLLEKTRLNVTWSLSSEFGHALCSIFDTGCPSDNCFCNTSYWNFYTLVDGEWSYSPVGFDGGFSCTEHYCANDGDVIGLAYGAFKTIPTKFRFEDICTVDEITTNTNTTTTIKEDWDPLGEIIKFSVGGTEISIVVLGIVLLLFILIYKA